MPPEKCRRAPAKHNSLRQAVQRQRQELSQQELIPAPAADERRLKPASAKRRRSSIDSVKRWRGSAQQAKLNAVKQRYQAGKEMAGKMASAGAAGVGIATAGTMAGVKLMVPGYDFSLKILSCRQYSAWRKIPQK